MISDENLHKHAVLAPYFEGDGKWTEDDWRWQYASYEAVIAYAAKRAMYDDGIALCGDPDCHCY